MAQSVKPKRLCVAKPPDRAAFTKAADILLRDARGFAHNAFKIGLARRVDRARVDAGRERHAAIPGQQEDPVTVMRYIGTATSRVDGHAKVTGAAKYAAEFSAPGLAHGAVVASTIAKGRIARIDVSDALRVDGVIDVLTHENRPRMASTDSAYKDDVAPDGSPFRPLYDDRVLFSEQPIALVVAEELGDRAVRGVAGPRGLRARTARHRLYRQRDQAKALEAPANPAENPFAPPKPRGTAEQAFAAAEVRHQGEYSVPIEHHNPMELYASTVIVEGDGQLTIFDKTQGVQNVQRYVCRVLELEPHEVRVMSPFMGGGFGSGLRPQYQVILAALAALALQRSVRVVLTRQQMYGLGYRPAMIQRIELGAKADGTLDAITHEAITVTSRYEDFHRQETGWSGLLYRCANAKYTHKLAQLDLPTSCDMRCSKRSDGRLRARMRDGRACGGAAARSP